MLYRLYQGLIAAQEFVRRGVVRGLDAMARVAGWAPSWREARWVVWRRALPWMAGVTVVVAAVGLMQWAGKPWLQQWQARRFVAQATQLAATGEEGRAAFYLRKALALQPQQPEATRLLAQLAERYESPTALLWYWRLAGSPEATTADRLALVRNALRHENPPLRLASNGLFAVPAWERNTVAYRALMAEYQLRNGRPSLAASEYEHALRLAPTNSALQVALNTVRLAAVDPRVAEEARTWLAGQADHPGHGLAVRRSLREYFFAETNHAAALEWSERVLAGPRADWSDQLRHLDALRLGRPAALNAQVEQVWQTATNHPGRVAAALQWLVAAGQAGAAIERLATLPAAHRNHPEIGRVGVGAYLAAGRAAELAPWLEQGHWGREDWHRRMWLTRSWRESGQAPAAARAWEELLGVAGDRPAWLWECARLAQRWEWRAEAAQLLELALPWLRRDAEEVPRWHDLLEWQGSSGELWRMYGFLAKTQTNWLVLNNYAALSLLTGREAQAAHALAQRLYLEYPRNEYCATTHAFSLHLQGRTTNGLAVLDGLPRRVWERPALAAYYGLLLAETGRSTAARPHLERAAQARLLPEERELVRRALERVQGAPWPERPRSPKPPPTP